jgi:tetratricopeptide (TPR) repeat protein
MTHPDTPSGNKVGAGFLTELRRRRVLPIAGAYIAIAWLITEIASFLLEQASAPGWSLRLLAIVFMVGFPMILVLAWVIQVQPGGKWSVDSSSGQRRTVVAAISLGILATAGLSWLILPRVGDMAAGPAYQPIPNSVAILPLLTSIGTAHERSIADTLYAALESGLDQSAELILMDLRNLKDQPGNLAEFGRSIKAAALLTGQILQAGGGTRIRMDLIDSGQGGVAWSQEIDWDPTRIAGTGTAIANGVLETLALPLLSNKSFTGTNRPQAYDAYLAGLRRAATYNIVDLALAMDDFQRAIDLDPEYVLAYVALAETIEWYSRYKQPAEEEAKALEERGKSVLDAAQAMAPDSADVVSAIGMYAPARELRIQAFKRALALDPNHAKSYHRLGFRAEDAKEAERLVRKALEFDPFNADWHNDLAGTLYYQGRDEEAFAELRRSIELEPELVFNHYRMGFWATYDLGRLDEGLIHWRKAYALDPHWGNLIMLIGGTYADFGAWEEALAWTERALERSPGNAWVPYSYYQIYYAMGEKDKALKYLRQAVDMEPDFSFSLHALGLLDIRDGRAEFALERWRRADPVLTSSDHPEIDENNLRDAMYYAANLMEAGETRQAEHLLQKCLDALDKWQNKTFVRESLVLEREMEIHAAGKRKEETLAAMRRVIVDNHNYSGTWMYKSPAFEFLWEDPEFQEIMAIMHAELARQLERIREMERNGELAPAPGVELNQ